MFSHLITGANMISIVTRIALLFTAVVATSGFCNAVETTKENKSLDPNTTVRSIIANYGEALKRGDTKTILSLYRKNAEIVPDGLPTVSSKDIEGFYNSTFKEIKIIGNLEIKDVIIEKGIAIVRCEESAEIFHLKTRTRRNYWFREIFILLQENEKWGIEKYMFSKIDNR
ncbi:TPA: nuclear transport factor 2 family protein [Pseudomonas aeruginosa]|nr:nuclear transport factor 2 family protein [Pseudomonas aeruginosa]